MYRFGQFFFHNKCRMNKLKLKETNYPQSVLFFHFLYNYLLSVLFCFFNWRPMVIYLFLRVKVKAMARTFECTTQI